MDSRVNKYYDSSQESKMIGSRSDRNSELYKEISKTELDNYEIKSNATVIGNNQGNIDVEKIKSILDTHYNQVPKRRTIRSSETEPEENETKPIFETKEYDINVIIDKAKEDKPDNYQEERAKKLRDTQFDILNNLDINLKDYTEDYENEDKSGGTEELQELINTITMNEQEIKSGKKPLPQIKKNPSHDSDPLDVLEDLKGSEDTVTLEGLQEKTEKLIQKMEETTSTSALDKSFFTKTNTFKDTDFDDFDDLKQNSNPFVKIIIAILVIIFMVGIIFLIKSFVI